MARSRALAQLVGPTMMAMAAALFLNRGNLNEMIGQVSRDYVLILMSGLITFVVGLALVRAHNLWKGWPAIVTAVGWLLILGGLVRLLFPAQLARLVAGVAVGPGPVTLVAVMALLIGAFLTFKGYGRARPTS